jgi:aminoglycoside 3'-phosphotransferase-2
VLDAQLDNSTWLARHVLTARPVLRVDEGDWAWLVSERLPGVPAHRPDLHGDVGSLAEVAGAALRALHALPLDAAPANVERGWDALAAVAEATVARGVGEVDEAYVRFTPDDLLSIWCAGRPSAEELVICHGDPALPNLMAHQGSFTGWLDLGAMRIADRHLDLAHAHASIHRNLGPEAVYVFYEAYGRDADLIRLDHYLLAKQLLP